MLKFGQSHTSGWLGMVTLVQRSLTFDEFLLRHGDNDRYELIDGELFDLEPTGPHEEVIAFIGQQLNVTIVLENLNRFIPHRCLIKSLGPNSAFRPDIIVLDRDELSKEPLWSQEPIITLGSTIKFVAEVVSSNWQNAYARKVEDYAMLGIAEYWIVDHAGLGGEDFIGRPKQPTLTICSLVDDRYQKRLFRGTDVIISQAFPTLKLTANQILCAGRSAT
jgi:Uma2 family endonuclease